MSLVEIQQYRSIRARLRAPPNAVHDDGIDLKRIIPDVEVPQFVSTDPDDIAFGPVVHPRRKPLRPTIQNIQREVAATYGVSVTDLRSARRPHYLSLVRHIGMYLCHTLSKYGSSETGRVFDKDHSSVLYGASRIARLRKEDPDLDKELIELASKFASPTTEDAPQCQPMNT